MLVRAAALAWLALLAGATEESSSGGGSRVAKSTGPPAFFLQDPTDTFVRIQRLGSVNKEFDVFSEVYLPEHRFGDLARHLFALDVARFDDDVRLPLSRRRQGRPRGDGNCVAAGLRPQRAGSETGAPAPGLFCESRRVLFLDVSCGQQTNHVVRRRRLGASIERPDGVDARP